MKRVGIVTGDSLGLFLTYLSALCVIGFRISDLVSK
jgi:hypothetical protein